MVERLFPAVLDRADELPDRSKLVEYFLTYAKSAEILAPSRKALYDLVEGLEARQGGESGDRGAQDVRGKNGKEGTVEPEENAGTGLPQLEAQMKEAIPHINRSKDSESSVSESESEKAGDKPLVLHDSSDPQLEYPSPKETKEYLDALFEEEEELEEEEGEDGEADEHPDLVDEDLDHNLGLLEDEELIELLKREGLTAFNEEGEEGGDGDYNPFKDLSIEELKKKLPPYLFKSPKEKKKFFRKMNQKYFESMAVDQKGKKKIAKAGRGVRFEMDRTQVRKFAKAQKIL